MYELIFKEDQILFVSSVRKSTAVFEYGIVITALAHKMDVTLWFQTTGRVLLLAFKARLCRTYQRGWQVGSEFD